MLDQQAKAKALAVAAFFTIAGCASNGAPNVPEAGPAAAGLERTTAQTSGLTIPYFESSFIYERQAYTYKMVGTNPKGKAATTTIPVEIVPVRFTFSNGVSLDASGVAASLPKSPLFNNSAFDAGSMQFTDAVMRSEFWKYTSKKNYHVLLGKPSIAATVTVPVPSSDGYTSRTAHGAMEGYVAYDWFILTIEPSIIHQLGIPPTTFTLFPTYNTNVLEEGGYCCYRGYHQAFPVAGASGTQIWTTAWASVTSKEMVALSHEISEWLNDPFYNNIVPSWIEPQDPAVCGGNLLEVGDPVTRHRFKSGGFALQDEAFFSWFSRQSPSIGFDGRYDLLGKLHGPAKSCP